MCADVAPSVPYLELLDLVCTEGTLHHAGPPLLRPDGGSLADHGVVLVGGVWSRKVSLKALTSHLQPENSLVCGSLRCCDGWSHLWTVLSQREKTVRNVVVGGCDEQLPLGLDGLALHGVLGDVSLLREKAHVAKFYSLQKGFL